MTTPRYGMKYSHIRYYRDEGLILNLQTGWPKNRTGMDFTMPYWSDLPAASFGHFVVQLRAAVRNDAEFIAILKGKR